MTEPVDLGSFVIDPKSILFNIIAAQSKATDGYQCLVSNHLKVSRPDLKSRAKHVFVNHTPAGWTLALTYGDMRWTRPLTEDEANLALSFDSREYAPISQEKIEVSLDLTSGGWRAEPKDTRKRPATSKKYVPRNGERKRRRTREYEKIQRALSGENPEEAIMRTLREAAIMPKVSLFT